MRFRGHFIGVMTLAIVTIVGASVDHSPATLIRTAPGAQWSRIEGFATADQLLAELSDLSGLRAAR